MTTINQAKMYNLNVNVATALPANLLSIEGVCTTPRTPEILNSLIAMTNPFDNFNSKISPYGSSSIGSDDSSSGSSPLASPMNSPPSVQHTCSQLIKEGLKLTIQTKRKQSGSDSRDDCDEVDVKRPRREDVSLTQEDEERRRRRRERNKIAATKCRLKKREKTVNLVSESEVLETQNIDLKTQIQDLEQQRRRLMDMLSLHAPNCVKNNNSTTTTTATTTTNSVPLQTFDEEYDNSDYRIDTVMHPFGKDPNFGKNDCYGKTCENYEKTVENDEATYTRLNSYLYNNQTMSVSNNYFNKNILRVNECGRSDLVYNKDKTDDILKFRYNDEESYKPNGVIDQNYYSRKSDHFYNNEYSNNFNNNIGNGCAA